MRTRILLGALAIVSLVAVFTTRVSRKMPDFEVYYTAGSRVLGGQPLYRPEDGHYQFKYLPAFAVLVAPVALVPLAVAKGLWFAVSAALMLALLWLSLRALPGIHAPPALLLVLTFAAMAKFYAHELVLGQVNLLFAALATGAVVWAERGRDAGAGVLFALAVVAKPYAAIFAPWLATRRTRTALAVMAAALGVLLALPAARYGWRGNIRLLVDWWHTIASTTAPNLTNPDNISLAGLFSKWLGEGLPATALAGLAAALLLAVMAMVVAARGRTASPEALEGSLLLLSIPLLSPQGWDYVLLVATPGVMLLIDRFPALPRGLRLATSAALVVDALAIYDVIGRDAYSAFMRMSIVTVCAAIEAAALAALRFRRAA